MQISFNQACSKGCSTLEEDLRLCEAAGFDFIEIRLDQLAGYLAHHTLEDLQAFFQTSRLKPHALNAIYLYDRFLSSRDDPENTQRLLERFMTACFAAQRIGAPGIIIVPPLQPDPKGGPYVGERREIAEICSRQLRQLARLAEPYGLRLCFELVGFPRSSVRTVEDARDIVETLALPNLGYVMDSYNLHLYHKLNDFSCLGDIDPARLWAVHINNGDAVPEAEMGQDKRCFPDQGEVDLDNFLEHVKKTGYDGMVSVETFRPAYWEKSPAWVVSEAYRTTSGVLRRNGCL